MMERRDDAGRAGLRSMFQSDRIVRPEPAPGLKHDLVVPLRGRRAPALAPHSKFVCLARIVSDVSLKRGRSFRIASSKAIICAVSNSEPIGRMETLPP